MAASFSLDSNAVCGLWSRCPNSAYKQLIDLLPATTYCIGCGNCPVNEGKLIMREKLNSLKYCLFDFIG